MIKMADERRINPRIDINSEITYRTGNSSDSHQGKLENLSRGGARIWIDEELPTSSQLLFRVESEIEELSMEFVATLLHSLPGQKQFMYGYGCIIEKTEDSTN